MFSFQTVGDIHFWAIVIFVFFVLFGFFFIRFIIRLFGFFFVGKKLILFFKRFEKGDDL